MFVNSFDPYIIITKNSPYGEFLFDFSIYADEENTGYEQSQLRSSEIAL